MPACFAPLTSISGDSMKPHDFLEHPEGGRFREVFRSDVRVETDSGRSRAALTHIYFSLNEGEVSRFHKVSSDEVWNLYEGAGLRLYTWTGGDSQPVCTVLSAATREYCHVVPAGAWQAAEPISGTVLVGCSVGPGFEFEDFELIDPESDQARRLHASDPSLSRFIDA